MPKQLNGMFHHRPIYVFPNSFFHFDEFLMEEMIRAVDCVMVDINSTLLAELSG
tara:strand:- start:18 stop:179 length:162 start_codon:yes stop_codon:yes gene_type:complete